MTQKLRKIDKDTLEITDDIEFSTIITKQELEKQKTDIQNKLDVLNS